MYSIDDLDVTKSCEDGYEFEVTDETTGEGSGVFLTVIGGHAQRIADFTKKMLNERRVAEAMHEKRGKGPKVTPVEEDMAFSIELIAMRVIAWRGIKEPYSHENAVKLCTVNPLIKEQVLKASNDMANFTKPFSVQPASSSDNQLG
jgi:hypothetical protein